MQKIKPVEPELKKGVLISKSGDVQKPGTSRAARLPQSLDKETPSLCCCYDKNRCNWKRNLIVVLYVSLYILVLGSYFFLILNASLCLIAHYSDIFLIDKTELYEYSTNGIGLTVIPSLNDKALVWFAIDNKTQYEKHVNNIEEFLNKRNASVRRNRDYDDLGPCGVKPYGYGLEPCVYIKINKQRGWVAKPIQLNSSEVDIPDEVRRWMKFKTQRLLIHCEGNQSWLKDHLGRIRYYPYPPGFDPEKFPLNMSRPSPVVAMQFTNFTLGLALRVQCTLWSDIIQSKVEFVLFVNKSQSP